MTFDWGAVFHTDRPLLETVLRGTLTYLSVIAILRVVLKRQSGSFGRGDMLLIVLIADASQNAMIGNSLSWTNGIALVLTLIAWNYIIDWATYHFPRVRDILEPPATLLISDGNVLAQNLRKERITDDELRAHLRLKGHADPRAISEARLESEGEFSALAAEPLQSPRAPISADELALLEAAARALNQWLAFRKDHPATATTSLP